ncbi:MAG: hypothetical protein QM270_00040 [Bacillota bacterium]|nr:hypothetical protein [Bacillota bacterium]
MKHTRIYAVLLTLLFVLLSACNPSTEDVEEKTQRTTIDESTEAKSSAGKEYTERVKVSHNITDADRLKDNRLYDYFSEKFQLDMEYIPMQFGERFEKARVWASSDDLPDLFWNDLNENIYSDWCGWIDAGLLAPLPDDVSAWPHLKATFDDYMIDELMSRNGKVYGLGALRDDGSEDFVVPISINYRADWAEKVGLRKENDIYTWDEWINLIKTCIEKDPGGNGEGKTYGWAAPQYYFPESFGIWLTCTYEWGFEEPMYMVVDGEYQWYPALPEYIKGLKVAKQIFDEGIIWTDIVLDTNSSKYADLYTAGQMVAETGGFTIGGVRNRRDRMLATNPDIDRRLCFMPAKVSSPFDDSFFWQKQSPCYWGSSSFSAKTTESQRERILDVWDFLLSQEGIDFRNYGIPGEDFIRKDDGTVESLWEKNEAGGYIDPYQGMRGFYGRAILNNMETNYDNPTIPLEDREDAWNAWKWDARNAHVVKVDFVQLYASTPNKDTLGFFVAETKAKAIELLVYCSRPRIHGLGQAFHRSYEPHRIMEPYS